MPTQLTAVLDDEFQVVGEKLRLLPVPVEIHADSDVAQFERAFVAGVLEIDFVVEGAFEQNLPVLHGSGVFPEIGLSLKSVGRLERERKLGQRHDADRQDRLLAEEFFFHTSGFGFVE